MSYRSEPTLLKKAAAGENKTITGTSGQTAAQPTGVNAVRLAYAPTTSGAVCYFEIGANPTAVVGTSEMLTDGSIEYKSIAEGDKIAVIGTDGILNVTPQSK